MDIAFIGLLALVGLIGVLGMWYQLDPIGAIMITISLTVFLGIIIVNERKRVLY